MKKFYYPTFPPKAVPCGRKESKEAAAASSVRAGVPGRFCAAAHASTAWAVKPGEAPRCGAGAGAGGAGGGSGAAAIICGAVFSGAVFSGVFCFVGCTEEGGELVSLGVREARVLR